MMHCGMFNAWLDLDGTYEFILQDVHFSALPKHDSMSIMRKGISSYHFDFPACIQWIPEGSGDMF